MFFAQQNQPFSRLDYYLFCDVDVKVRTRMRVHGFSTFKNNDLASSPFLFDQPRFCWLWEVEIFREPSQAVEPVVHIDGYHSHWFHRIIANAQKRQHEIHLLDCDRVVLVGVEEGDGCHHKDGQHEMCYIIVGHIAVEDVVVVVLLNEKIIVFLNYDIFPSDELGPLEFV